MKIVQENLLHKFKKTFYILALIAVLLTPSAVSYAADEGDVSTNAEQKVEQNTQDQTAEKRKEILDEAKTALDETKNALKALDDGNNKDALIALEKATGKLEIILARDPSLALAPTGVDVVHYDILGSVQDIIHITEKAENLLEDGKVAEARRLLKGVGKESVISTKSLPLATYPQAIKVAAKLIDDEKTEEAKVVLQTALSTVVVTETVVPLPVLHAGVLLEEAEALAETEERSDEDNERLAELLNEARTEIEFGQALGYGDKEEFESLFKEIKTIQEKTSDGKSGTGFFDKIKSFVTSMLEGKNKTSNG
mgnify:FL=1